jgi:hypothetical protein
MKDKVRQIYKSFDTKRKIYESEQADKDDLAAFYSPKLPPLWRKWLSLTTY